MSTHSNESFGFLTAPGTQFPAKAREIFNDIVEASKTDLELRQRLVEDPVTTLKDYYHVPVSEDKDIRFVEMNGADVVIVLPDPVDETAELSEADLEAVAGGAAVLDDCWFITITSAGCQNTTPTQC